jgi:hypothetical protein
VKDKEFTERENRVREKLKNLRKPVMIVHPEDREKLRRKHKQEWTDRGTYLESQGYF